VPQLREVPGPGYCRTFWTVILIIALDSETVALLIAGFRQSKERWRQVLRVEAFDRLGRLAGRRECTRRAALTLNPNYEGAKSFVVSEGAEIMSGGFPLGRGVLSGSGRHRCKMSER
jgi:hypothetical protein